MPCCQWPAFTHFPHWWTKSCWVWIFVSVNPELSLLKYLSADFLDYLYKLCHMRRRAKTSVFLFIKWGRHTKWFLSTLLHWSAGILLYLMTYQISVSTRCLIGMCNSAKYKLNSLSLQHLSLVLIAFGELKAVFLFESPFSYVFISNLLHGSPSSFDCTFSFQRHTPH